jgi:high affinity Mn2+ porin
MSTRVLLLRSVAAVIGAARASLHGISVNACSSLLPAAHTRGHLVESELQLQNWAAYCKQLGKQVSKAAKANASTMPRSGGLRFFIASASMRCRVQPFRFAGLGAITKLARLIWIAAFVAAAPAMAAERALKAPWQSPVVQAYDWTGLYVGAHLGYAWGPSNWSAPPDLSSSLDFDQSSDIFTGNGSYIGGLQIGYDYMLPNRVVLGVQVDASFPGFPNLDGISTGGMSIFSAPATGLASYTESVLSSGTVRGRFGYAPGNWLFYATGGFAWTYDQLTLTQLADGTTDSPFLWRLGWAAGLGVEYALAPNWTVNVEYLFTKYGNSSVMFPSAALQFTSDLSLQQARASLNYRFGGGGTNANGGSTGLPTPATDLVNFHGQTTFVWQGYPAIRSPYAGPFSLPGSGLGRETFDATLYAGIRLWQGAEVWITPEIDQGFGFADTHGVAGFPSGESYKLGSSYPYTRMQRIFFRQTVNLGGEVEKVDADISQFAGTRTENRLVLTIGKFAIVDIFDTNKYANSPKTDFLNWSLINAGTFDYAGDGWGYTYGAAAEWYQGSWTLRAGAFDLSKTPAGGGSPHGGSLDPTFQQYAVLAEIEKRYELWGQPGKLKVTGFVNRGRAGRFQDAIALAQITGEPADIIAVRSYTSRPGVSMNLEQQISDTVGVFARAGWADGNIEPWDFTDIDRTVSGGVSINGKNWGRPDDTIGIAGVYNNISSVHRAFFDAGGLGILIGDGQLPNPGPERIFEAYYSYALPSNMRVSFDYQFIANPAYNTDRGPVNTFAARFHARF